MLANQTGLSSKYVSERHAIASQSKLTAGEAAKVLKKKGIVISAKELFNAFKLLKGYEPEWHHSGFYKGTKGSTMGRTFFFKDLEIEEIAERFNEIELKKNEIKAIEEKKKETIVCGFYYDWDYDYSGRYGKKTSFKVLHVYNGNELGIPKNFTKCTFEQFQEISKFIGKKYYGWSEPVIADFVNCDLLSNC